MTVVAPNLLIRLPVKNDGTNMPSTCRKMTQWASACENPQPTMASGEALMMKDIVPNASMPAIADAMKRGWLAITQQRTRRRCSLGRTGGGSRRRHRGEADEGHDRENDDVQAEEWRRRSQGKAASIRSCVTRTRLGPITAAATPPAVTHEIALAR